MKLSILYLTLLATLTTFNNNITAQSTAIYTDPLATYKQAKHHYALQEYSLAYPLFKLIQANTISNSYIANSDVQYYTTACALLLRDTTAVLTANQYILTEPNNARVQMMQFQLAEYHYYYNQYSTALPYYEAAQIDNLSNADIAKLTFHKGYCYFATQQYAKAKPLFNAIRQLPDNANYIDANYYYGFIAFYDKEYKIALESLKKVDGHPTYGQVVPFYIAEIYYFTNQKEKALTYAENTLQKNSNTYYDLELRQLVGHLYFEKKLFDKALPYLEKYVTESNKVSREDVYELSYCYYTQKRWAKAIEGLKQLSASTDSLGQNSMYLLGDAYLNVNQKANARTAFAYCAANSSNEIQRQISKFTYAKLSYELGYTNVALTELQDYITEFARANNINEAKELLVAVLATTNNYRAAQQLIESLNQPSETTQKLYPQVLYGRATEYINDQDYNTALQLIDKILANKYNTPVLPATKFWKGELSYKDDKIDNAITYLEAYLAVPVIQKEINPTNAKYTLGHAYLKNTNYSRALGYFNSIGDPSSTSTIIQDAYVRTADCYYITKDYKNAIERYTVAIDKNWNLADYATYQKALAVGITNNTDKIKLLQSIAVKYPTSTLNNDATIEIATTYMAMSNFTAAIPYLTTITNSNTINALKPKALLNLGLCYSNLNKDSEALTTYKKLVTQFPNTTESDDAIENTEKIYLENGNTTAYTEFMKQVGKPLSISTADSITYRAAENLYKAGNIVEAIDAFNNYLIKYNTGSYILNANYYLAELYNSKQDYKNAIPYYTYVANNGASKYSERAISQAAKIYYFELKDYSKAEQYFTQLLTLALNNEAKLDATRGLLRCLYYQEKYSTAITIANDLSKNKAATIDDKVLSNLILAKVAQSELNYADAIAKYKTVLLLNKSNYAAEARYQIAACYYALNKLGDAEKAANEVISKSGSYELWLTKSYILLGDIYYTQKDYFNAKATYKSVAESTTIAALKNEALTKLDKTTAEEKANSKINNQ